MDSYSGERHHEDPSLQDEIENFLAFGFDKAARLSTNISCELTQPIPGLTSFLVGSMPPHIVHLESLQAWRWLNRCTRDDMMCHAGMEFQNKSA